MESKISVESQHRFPAALTREQATTAMPGGTRHCRSEDPLNGAPERPTARIALINYC